MCLQNIQLLKKKLDLLHILFSFVCCSVDAEPEKKSGTFKLTPTTSTLSVLICSLVFAFQLELLDGFIVLESTFLCAVDLLLLHVLSSV